MRWSETHSFRNCEKKEKKRKKIEKKKKKKKEKVLCIMITSGLFSTRVIKFLGDFVPSDLRLFIVRDPLT